MLRNLTMLLMLLTITVMLLTGCGAISLVGSTTSLALSNNIYSKTWSSVDLTTYLITEKDIKTHVYDTITTVEKKVDETFIISKPKESDTKILTVKVEESELFKPDESIVLANTSSSIRVEDKICNANEWYVLSFLIFLGSLVYLFIHNKKPKLKIRKRKRKTKKKKIKKKKKNK